LLLGSGLRAANGEGETDYKHGKTGFHWFFPLSMRGICHHFAISFTGRRPALTNDSTQTITAVHDKPIFLGRFERSQLLIGMPQPVCQRAR
jgi:hypothetical protein